MTKRKRPTQRHSLEMKITLVRQVIESGKSQAEVSRETGISQTNIHHWVAQARAGELGTYKVPEFDVRTGDLPAEVRRLERALLQVTQERDF